MEKIARAPGGSKRYIPTKLGEGRRGQEAWGVFKQSVSFLPRTVLSYLILFMVYRLLLQ